MFFFWINVFFLDLYYFFPSYYKLDLFGWLETCDDGGSVSLHIHTLQFSVMDSYLYSILALKLNMDPALGTSLVNANCCLQY
jgi:hypothetical protein